MNRNRWVTIAGILVFDADTNKISGIKSRSLIPLLW